MLSTEMTGHTGHIGITIPSLSRPNAFSASCILCILLLAIDAVKHMRDMLQTSLDNDEHKYNNNKAVRFEVRELVV